MMLKLIFEERKTLKLSNNSQAKTERPALSPAIYHQFITIISVARLSSQLKVNNLLLIRVGNFESSSKKILSCSQWQTPILVTPPCTGQPRCVDSYFYIVSVLNFLWCVDFHFDIVSVLSFSDNTFKAFFFVSMEALTRQQQIISKILYFFPLKT